MRYLKAALAAVGIGLAAWIASQAYLRYPPLGWLTLLAFLVLIVYGALRELLAQLPPVELGWRGATRGSRARERALEELVEKLPATSDAVAYRIRELLISRISAREGVSAAEAASRAGSYVKDELLLKILNGEVKPLSSSEVRELLEKISEV